MEDARFLGAHLRSEGRDELNVHKTLYLAQLVSLADEDSSPLFHNGIQAWDYGPVIPDVWFSKELNQPLQDTGMGEFLRIISESLPEGGAVIDLLHQPGSLWASCYQQGENNRMAIPSLQKQLQDPTSVEAKQVRLVQARLDEYDKQLYQTLSEFDLSEFEQAEKLVIKPFSESKSG